MHADYVDQLKILDPSRIGWDVHLIGAGGIGSPTAFLLGRNGVHTLHVYDSDRVERRNLSAQLTTRADDLEMPKVEALLSFFERQQLDTTLVIHDEMVTESTMFDGLVISAVDSMESRAAIWKAVKGNPLVPVYFDGRIGGEQMALHIVDPNDMDACERYEHLWMYSSENTLPLECGSRTNSHTPAVLAGLIIAEFAKFTRGEPLANTILLNLATRVFESF